MADSNTNHKVQITGEDKSAAAFESVKQRISRLDVAFGVFLGNMAASAARQFGSFVSSAFRAVDELNDLKASTGITNQELAALEAQAALSGTSLENASKSALKLAQAVQDSLTNKTTPAAQALRALGISADQLRAVQNDSVGQFKLVADALGQYQDGAQKAALAADVFGGKNTEVLRLLREGSEGFDDAAEMAREFGLTLDEVQVQGLVQANDAIDSVGLAIQGLARQAAAQLAPSITAVSEQFLDAARSAGVFENSGSIALAVINVAVATVFEGVSKLALGFKVLAIGASTIITSVVGVVGDLVAALVWVAEVMDGDDSSAAFAAKRLLGQLRRLEDEGFSAIADAARELQTQLSGDTASEDYFRRLEEASKRARRAADDLGNAKPPPPLPGGGGDKDAQREADRLARLDAARKLALGKELEDIAAQFATKEQMLRDTENAQLKAIEEAHDKKLLNDQNYAALRLAVEQKFQADVDALREAQRQRDMERQTAHFREFTGVTMQQMEMLANFSKQTTLDQASTVLGLASNFFANLSTVSRRAFKIYQAIAIAEAVVATAKAAIEGFAWGMGHGGPYVAAAMVALAVAAGIAQIAKIRSAQPGGGAVSGGGAVGGVGVGDTAGGGTASIDSRGRTGGPTEITLVLQGRRYDRQDVIDMVDMLNEVAPDGARINVIGGTGA